MSMPSMVPQNRSPRLGPIGVLALSFGLSLSASAGDLPRKFALGVSGGLQAKTYNQNESLKQFTPELFGYYYTPMSEVLDLRYGTRLGYAGAQENDKVPGSVTLEEHDYKGTIEATLVYRQFTAFYPALGAGVGAIIRKHSLNATRPVVSVDPAIESSQLYWLIYGQFSAIMAINDNQFELAPYIRYNHVFDDNRLAWQYGLEFSVRLGG